MSMRDCIASVFEAQRFDSPRQDRLHLPPEVLRSLVDAFAGAGYHEMMPRARAHPGIVRDLPNIHYDDFDGPTCFAKWVRLRQTSGAWVMLPVSYVAPVFSATDSLYPEDDSRHVHDVRQWARTADVAGAISRAEGVLKPAGFLYVEWNAAALDEPMPMRDVPEATVRDLIFNYQAYE